MREYEVIRHNNANFHIFLVNMLYRTPHFHQDIEIGLILDGEVSMITTDGCHTLRAGDLYLFNPYQSHEIQSEAVSLILALQVSPDFFADYCPQAGSAEFEEHYYAFDEDSDFALQARKLLLDTAMVYYRKDELNELLCASWINQLFYHLLKHIPHRVPDEKERTYRYTKISRIRSIANYISEHYTEKLLLSQVAENENLSLYYASHLFKEYFGISFQDYIAKLRCEKARTLLILSDASLLDISIQCGFSDMRYFNSGFRKQFGCFPKEYRRRYHDMELLMQQQSVLSTQEFLSRESGFIILDRYMREKRK